MTSHGVLASILLCVCVIYRDQLTVAYVCDDGEVCIIWFRVVSCALLVVVMFLLDVLVLVVSRFTVVTLCGGCTVAATTTICTSQIVVH